MRTQKPRAVGLLLVFAATVTMLQTTSPAQASGTDSAQYFAQMNQERADHGLVALAWRSDLADIAQRWAQHMSSTHELAHNPNLARQVHYWQVVGENVGDGPTLDDLDRAFMSSAEHRDNILDSDYTEAGVGSVRDDSGVIWIAIDFREPLVRHSASGPTHTSTPAMHWTRGAVVTPAASRKPHAQRPTPTALLMLRAEFPFAPGCMLRFGWF